jgi:transposase-like protein
MGIGAKTIALTTRYERSSENIKGRLLPRPPGRPITIRSSKYLNNLIEQDHRAIKSRIRPMLGFKDFVSAQITLAGVELLHRIRQGQFELRKLGVAKKTAPEIWNAVLAA